MAFSDKHFYSTKIYKLIKLKFIVTNNIIDYFMKVFEDSVKKIGTLGSYQIYILFLLSFLFLGFKKEFLILFIGILMLYTIAVPIRLLFFKQRPIPKKFDDIFGRISASSIPSLHSARITLIVLFFVYFTKVHLLFTFFATVIVIIVLYSRVYFKKHYLIDVIAGVVIGVMCYYLTVYLIDMLFVI